MLNNLSRSVVAAGVTLLAATSMLAAQTPDSKVASVCKDGTTSPIAGKGACSGHKGVDSAATKAVVKTAKAQKAQDKAAKAKLTKDPDKAAAAQAKADKAQSKADKAEDKAAKDPTGASAQCKDGTYSHAKTSKGACSRHGGVAKSLKP